jgi:hypothetical protein
VARALGLARGTLYLTRKQATKDKQVAIAIEQSHETRDEQIRDRSQAEKEALHLSWESK